MELHRRGIAVEVEVRELHSAELRSGAWQALDGRTQRETLDKNYLRRSLVILYTQGDVMPSLLTSQ